MYCCVFIPILIFRGGVSRNGSSSFRPSWLPTGHRPVIASVRTGSVRRATTARRRLDRRMGMEPFRPNLEWDRKRIPGVSRQPVASHSKKNRPTVDQSGERVIWDSETRSLLVSHPSNKKLVTKGSPLGDTLSLSCKASVGTSGSNN